MRCQACDYELWHCTGRNCPECGDGFSLANFVFEKNTVLFHCPHCDHGIKGEGPTGKPLLSLEQCEVCGLALSYETFIIRPIEGADANSFGSLLPISMTSGNWFTRYFSTVWLVLTKPQIAISRVPVQEPLWNAWKFYIKTIIVTVVSTLLLFGFFLFQYSPAADFLILLATAGGQYLLIILFSCICIVLWSCFTHVLLQITGGSTFTLRRTMQAMLYGGGASIVSIVPCLGWIASFVWWIVSTTNMVSRGQRVHGGRATFASLVGVLVLFVFICGTFTMMMNAITAPLVARARITAQQRMQQQSTQVEQTEEEFTDQYPE